MTRYRPPSRLALRNVEVEGRVVDVVIDGGLITAVGDHLPAVPSSPEIDGEGGALIPGLHDHHLHLHALAARSRSVRVGPPEVRTRADLRRALAGASSTGSRIRAVDYHESVCGMLDRDVLDSLVSDTPVMVQHRTGALWILNSRAMELVAPALAGDPDGVEHDEHGRPNGRLWRFDDRLRSVLPEETGEHRKALRALSARMVRLGLTGATDATPAIADSALAMLEETVPLRLHLLGFGEERPLRRGWSIGPRKLLLHDHDLPSLDQLVEMIDPCRRGPARRPVAVHCVTRESLILTLCVLARVGACAGDRIEHGAVIPHEVDAALRKLRLTVVTQPDFLRSRGDDYLREVDAEDRTLLYRWGTLRDAHVPVVPSSDAPYGELDPWQVIRSARDRSTMRGAVIGESDRVSAAAALRGYLSSPADPGRRSRRVARGQLADLCLLAAPLRSVLADPHPDAVQAVLVEGAVLWHR